jgi:hypothetical protein
VLPVTRLIHLCSCHWGAGHATGVPRFSRYFKRAFPDVEEATPESFRHMRGLKGAVVVADNHLVLQAPESLRAIAVHHGCAQTHYDRDPRWQSEWSRHLCSGQRRMFNRRRTEFVAPSAWVAEEFARFAGKGYRPHIIPHWVEPITCSWDVNDRPVVIGDWRDYNKGAECIGAMRDAMPELEFRQLDFPAADDEARHRFYGCADAYLCLSLSEGGPYSVLDAEAARLPIVTTRVGNVEEFANVQVIENRESVDEIRAALERVLGAEYELKETMFTDWTFDVWRDRWREVLQL